MCEFIRDLIFYGLLFMAAGIAWILAKIFPSKKSTRHLYDYYP